MKRFCLAILGVCCISYAALAYNVMLLSRIGPTYSSSNVTIAAGGAGVRNCLNNLDVRSDADYTVRVLDGATTSYTIAATSGSVLIRAWDVDQSLCGSANTAMYINISAGNANINYTGYTY